MKRWFGSLLSIMLTAACASGPYPAPHAHPTKPLGVQATIAGAPAADVELTLHTLERGVTNADGYFVWLTLVEGPRHLVAVKGECRGEMDVAPENGKTWSIVLTCPEPPKPAFQITNRPLVGPLVVDKKMYRDDTGNRRVFFNSWFSALRVLRDNPTEFYRQIDAIAAANYQGTRIFLAVGGWMDFWDNHEVVPVGFTKWFFCRESGFLRPCDGGRQGSRLEAWPDYDDLYRTLLREFKKRGLRLHIVTSGDAQIIYANDTAKELAVNERLARIAAEEGGRDVVALVESTNEFPMNRYGGQGPESIAQIGRVLDVWRKHIPGVLTAQGAIPQNEEVESLQLASTHGEVLAVHVTRSPVAVALKRSMGLVYFEGNYRAFPKPFWQGEPAGDGEDSFDRLDDRAALTALYAIHAITGQGSNQFSGQSVRNAKNKGRDYATLDEAWSFAALPRILAVLPEDIATWSRETAGRGAILYWIRDKQFAAVTFEEWDPTPPRPVAEWTLYAGDRVERGTGNPPAKRTGLLVGTFQ